MSVMGNELVQDFSNMVREAYREKAEEINLWKNAGAGVTDVLLQEFHALSVVFAAFTDSLEQAVYAEAEGKARGEVADAETESSAVFSAFTDSLLALENEVGFARESADEDVSADIDVILSVINYWLNELQGMGEANFLSDEDEIIVDEFGEWITERLERLDVELVHPSNANNHHLHGRLVGMESVANIFVDVLEYTIANPSVGHAGCGAFIYLTNGLHDFAEKFDSDIAESGVMPDYADGVLDSVNEVINEVINMGVVLIDG